MVRTLPILLASLVAISVGAQPLPGAPRIACAASDENPAGLKVESRDPKILRLWAETLIDNGAPDDAFVEFLQRASSLKERARAEFKHALGFAMERVDVLMSQSLDSFDQFISDLDARGKFSEAREIGHVKTVLGMRVAMLVITADPEQYGAIRDLAKSLAESVELTKLSRAQAEAKIIEKAVAAKTVSLRKFIAVIKSLDPAIVGSAAQARAEDRDLQVRVRASIALAVTLNPEHPNLVQALETVGI